MSNVFIGAIPKKKKKKREPKMYHHFGVQFFTGNYTAGGGEEFYKKEFKIQRVDEDLARQALVKYLRKKYPKQYFEIYSDGYSYQ